MFARCCIGLLHDEIVRLNHRPKRDRRKIRRLATAIGSRNKSNDVCAHDNPSQTAIATSPATASDIRYAVIRFLSQVNKMRGMTAIGAIISGANPIP